MSGVNKATKAETEERTSIVLDMLLSGLKRREILKNIENNENLKWGIRKSQVDQYIAKANAIIAEYSNTKRDEIFAKGMARYDFLYMRLVNIKDYKNAAVVVDKQIDLAGIKVTKIAETDTKGNDKPSRPIIVVKTSNGDIQ